MNAALFMLTSAWMAGADVQVTPAPAPAPAAPAVVSTGSSCGGGCATACDPCASKPGLFSKMRGRFSGIGGHKSCDSCAPACAPAPAPVVMKHAPVTTSCCEQPCGKSGLFSRLSFGGHKSSSCGGCATACGTGPCDGAITTVPPAKPEVIPPPKKEEKKEMPKGGTTGITIEPVLTPVVAPKPIDLNGQKNPF